MQSSDPVSVFITGASTPLGREVARQLTARGHRVTGLTTGSDGAAMVRQDGGIPAFSDLFRVGEMKSVLGSAQAQVVLHLEPQLPNTFPQRGAPWETTGHVLDMGTVTLLEAAQAAGAQFFVHASYAFLYGDQHGAAVDEDTRRDTALAFRPALTAEDAALGGSIPACVLRAGTLYGPHDAGMLGLAEALRRGRSVYVGDPHPVMNWVYVADLARAVVLAAEQRPAGQVFNVSDDSPAPAAEFAGFVAASLGLSLPAPMPEFAARAFTSPMQRLLLSQSAQVSSAKIRAGLGWAPRYATYRAGLEQTLLVWRAEEPVRT